VKLTTHLLNERRYTSTPLRGALLGTGTILLLRFTVQHNGISNTFTYLGYKISYEEERKLKKIFFFTNIQNSDQYSKSKFSPKAFSTERTQYFS
jgi:hypothetical protein